MDFWIWFGRSADVLGLAGLVYTIWVAKNAERAARDARAAALRSIATYDLQKAISLLKETKQLHRNSLKTVAIDRYSSAREILVAVREIHAKWRTEMNSVILELQRMETEVESGVVGMGNEGQAQH